MPVISTVIGEGGSGGALAIGVCDHLVMLGYSTYSVISPEGCASILWKKAEYASTAAEAMGVTAKRLQELGLVDSLVEEPLGGAHQDPELAATNLKEVLVTELDRLCQLDEQALVDLRYEKIRSFGAV